MVPKTYLNTWSLVGQLAMVKIATSVALLGSAKLNLQVHFAPVNSPFFMLTDFAPLGRNLAEQHLSGAQQPDRGGSSREVLCCGCGRSLIFPCEIELSP